MFVFGTADDVFAMAMRIEENGKAFYTGLAEKAHDWQLKDLFAELARMEDGHIQQFKALRGNLPQSAADMVWDPEGLAPAYLQATADTHVFTVESALDRLKEVHSPLAALDLALAFERDSVAFFIGMKEILPDPSGKGEIDKLIRSEMDHIRMLAQARRQVAATGTATLG